MISNQNISQMVKTDICCTQSWMKEQHNYQSKMKYIGRYFSRSTKPQQEKQQEAMLEVEQKAIDAYFDRLMFSVLKLPQSQDNSLQKHIKNIVYEVYSEENQRIIKDELQHWKEYPIVDLVNEEYDQKVIDLYKRSPVLSARVLHRLSQLIDCSRYSKPDENSEFQLKKQFGQFLRKEEVNLSFNRYCFEKYRRFIYHAEDHIQMDINEVEFAEKVRDWASKNQEKDQTIKKLLEFLQKIGLIVYENKKDTQNAFIQIFERIKKEDQRKMLLLNYRHHRLEQILNNTEQNIGALYPNYNFYKNKGRICRSQLNITQLHGQKYNYGFLETSHDYIQWMFPNHYGSAFNSRSKPLDYIESQLFKRDLEIGVRMLKSIYIFLDFMGLRFEPRTLDIKVCSQRRFQEVIMVNYHNHLRIMRILACLSVTGFRKVALKLIDILDQYTQKDKPFEKERREFERSWNIYGEATLKKAKEMCFLDTEEFPQDHEVIKMAANLQIVIESKHQEKREEQIDIEIPQINNQLFNSKLMEVEDFDSPINKSKTQSEHENEPKPAESSQPEQINTETAVSVEVDKTDSKMDEEKPDSSNPIPIVSPINSEEPMQEEKTISLDEQQNPSYIVPSSQPSV